MNARNWLWHDHRGYEERLVACARVANAAEWAAAVDRLHDLVSLLKGHFFNVGCCDCRPSVPGLANEDNVGRTAVHAEGGAGSGIRVAGAAPVVLEPPRCIHGQVR